MTIDNGSNPDFDAATDEIASKHYQYVKLVDGTLDSTEKIPGTAANGLDVDVTRMAPLVAGTAFAGKVQLTDGTSDATVRNLAANDALNVAIVDGSGNQVTSFAGSGGTSSTDDADFTATSTAGTPIMGVRQDTPRTVTNEDMGIAKIDSAGRLEVNVGASDLDVAHDLPDANAPVKTGARGVSALPAAVAANDRANNISDLYGRQLVGHIAPQMQTWKSYNTTSTATGALIWAPGSGKRIAITHLTIGTYGTTAARLILWFGATADTTYSAGTDQLVFAGSFAPSSTAKPGAVLAPAVPMFAATTDHELHITTDAALSVDVAVYGYEFTP